MQRIRQVDESNQLLNDENHKLNEIIEDKNREIDNYCARFERIELEQ